MPISLLIFLSKTLNSSQSKYAASVFNASKLSTLLANRLPVLRKNKKCLNVWGSRSKKIMLLFSGRSGEFSRNIFDSRLGMETRVLLHVTNSVPPTLNFIISFWSCSIFCNLLEDGVETLIVRFLFSFSHSFCTFSSVSFLSFSFLSFSFFSCFSCSLLSFSAFSFFSLSAFSFFSFSNLSFFSFSS